MKIIILTFVVITSFSSCIAQNENGIFLKNTLDIARNDELVTISKEIVQKYSKGSEKGVFPILKSAKGEIIPSQLEDIDHDGTWDQLLLTTSFKPKEQKSIHVTFATKPPSFPKITDVHFGVGSNTTDSKEVQSYSRKGDPRNSTPKKFFQMEGPAWENDKVGFRMYFDPRNGIDIFGKTTSDIVLSTVGISGDYHTKEDWGMDILKVGNSLGAGSIAIKLNDSLYRITGIHGTTFKVLEEGPIKASFEMQYADDQIENTTIQTKHKISIYKGQWYYKSDVLVSDITKEMELTTGIVNLKSNLLRDTTIENHFVLSSYGKQSEHGDHLGMAIFFDKNLYESHQTIGAVNKEITSTHYVSLKTVNNQPISYYFLAGWESSHSMFGLEKGFQKLVATTIKRLSHPIIVTYEESH